MYIHYTFWPQQNLLEDDKVYVAMQRFTLSIQVYSVYILLNKIMNKSEYNV